MRVLLLDTNVVSILFKPDHALHAKCLGLVSGNQLFISFMTRAELLLWPRQNQWGSKRAEELLKHVELCTTLFPGEKTCVHWVGVVSEIPLARQRARRWDLPLITTDYRDFEHLLGPMLVPVM